MLRFVADQIGVAPEAFALYARGEETRRVLWFMDVEDTGSEERGQTQGRRLKPEGCPVRSPGSVRTDQVPRIRNSV